MLEVKLESRTPIEHIHEDEITMRSGAEACELSRKLPVCHFNMQSKIRSL